MHSCVQMGYSPDIFMFLQKYASYKSMVDIETFLLLKFNWKTVVLFYSVKGHEISDIQYDTHTFRRFSH
jgi:hypothetical protein